MSQDTSGSVALFTMVPEIAKTTGLTQPKVMDALRTLVTILSREADAGKRIEIGTGKGKLFIATTEVRGARKGRNPATGEAIDIPEKRVWKIKAGKNALDLHKK